MKVFSHFLSTKKAGLPSRQLIRKAVLKTLSYERKQIAGEANVIFVDKPTIRRLHRSFLKDSSLTDVIAFPYDSLSSKDAPFGDIYVCTEVAKQNAFRFGQSYPKEVIRLVVHGTLHLLGYSDLSASSKKKMWKRQEEIIDLLFGTLANARRRLY